VWPEKQRQQQQQQQERVITSHYSVRVVQHWMAGAWHSFTQLSTVPAVLTWLEHRWFWQVAS
jgi:hypothetical protein